MNLVGGTTVLTNSVQIAVDNIVDLVNRYAGNNRYATSVAVADAFFNGLNAPRTIGVASGERFPDALTGGRHSGLNNEPLLLVKTSSLPVEIKNYVSTNASTISGGFVYGGATAVSDGVKNAIEALY